MNRWVRVWALVAAGLSALAWGCGSGGGEDQESMTEDGHLGSSSQSLAATSFGSNYASQCSGKGVPIPPPFGTSTVDPEGVYEYGKWTRGGDALIGHSLDGALGSRVYTSESILTGHEGLCVIAADYGGATGSQFDVICQGRSGYACFYEAHTASADPPATPMDIVNTLDSGTKLTTHDTCTGCHAGRNAFIAHNSVVNDGLNGQNDPFGGHDYWMLSGSNWFTPIVPAGWPENPGPSNDGYPAQCTNAACHAATGTAGPFPALRTSAFGYDAMHGNHYCAILDHVVRAPSSEGGMPPGQCEDPNNPACCSGYNAPGCPANTNPQVKAMLAACAKPEPSTAVSYRNSPAAMAGYSFATPYTGAWDHTIIGTSLYESDQTYLLDNLYNNAGGYMNGWSGTEYTSLLMSSYRPALFAKGNDGANLTLAVTNYAGQVQEKAFGSGGGYRTVSSTLAAGSPYGRVRLDGSSIIVFRGTDGFIYQSVWTGSAWTTTQPSGQLLKATGDPIAYNRGSTTSIVYKCAEEICELRLISGAWQFRIVSPAAPLLSNTLPVPFKRSLTTEYEIFYAAADGLHMITDPTEPNFGSTTEQVIYADVITSTPAPYDAQDGGVRVAFISDYGTGNNSYVSESVRPSGSSSWLTYHRLGTYNNLQRFVADPAAYKSTLGRNTILFRNSANTFYQLQAVSSTAGEVEFARTTIQKGYDINTSGALTQGQQQTWSLYLPPGQYKFDLAPSSGDADLYVMQGGTPSTTSYDCRPYASGTTAESCVSTLPGPSYSYINVMVNGYAPTTSSFTIKGYFND